MVVLRLEEIVLAAASETGAGCQAYQNLRNGTVGPHNPFGLIIELSLILYARMGHQPSLCLRQLLLSFWRLSTSPNQAACSM